MNYETVIWYGFGFFNGAVLAWILRLGMRR